MSVEENLRLITQEIQQACERLQLNYPVRLVAVSKVQPVSKIVSAYVIGHRNFGENYVEELIDKANQLPPDIEWHMIGHLQSNKAKKILQIPNLFVLETLDSTDLAVTLNKECNKLGRTLNVYLQVNTSAESSKSGLHPASVMEATQFIIENCPQVIVKGLMTIGMPGEVGDFVRLREIRDELRQNLGLVHLELSMGMTNDFQAAIEHGSTNVRVGTAIFGERKR